MEFHALYVPPGAGLTKTWRAPAPVSQADNRLHSARYKTIFLAMKLTAVILLVAALHVSAKGFTQRVTLSVKDAPLSGVLNQIKKQTGFSFLWDERHLRFSKRVSLSVINEPMRVALDACMKDQPLTYSIIDNMVVIKSKPVNHSSETTIEEPAPPVEIHGLVIGENGDPLAGVTIMVKGTSRTATTNDDGKYTIIVNPGETLIFSYTGFAEKEAKVSGKPVLDITLQNSGNNLHEVVVVGYGVQKRRDVVGSVGVASRKDFGDVAVTNTSQLIQGKIAGVQVLNNSGDPGSGSQIIVRGTGTFTNASPLYVIDGIQSDPSTFNSLSSFDIQDITVLKDASSVAIYGAQGANGVVIITTRRARNSKPRVTYDGYAGISKPWKQFDMLDAAQYTDLVKEWYVNQGQTLPPRLSTPGALVSKTDWQKEMFKTGTITEHHINIGGASEFMNYSVSLGYTKQQSQVIKLDYQRANLRVNLEERVGKRFKFGQQLNIRYEITNGLSTDILGGLRMPPYIAVYDSTNLLGGFGIATSAQDGNDTQNPLIQPSLRDVKNRGLNNYLQLFGEVDILKGLKFRSQFGGNYIFNQGYNYNPTYAGNQLITPNQISEAYAFGLSYIMENYFTYNKEIGEHAFNITAGNSYRDGGKSRFVNLVGSDFANDEIHQLGVAKTIGVGLTGANSNSRFISYFARINYTLMNKYILAITERRDASSLLSPNDRVGYFPSVGLGWRLSEEPLIKKIPFISDLKLRASWGKTGNSNIPGYSYVSSVWTGGSNSVVYPLGINEVLINGATVAVPSTPSLRWETTTTTDVGIDALLFNNALNVGIGYYNRNNQNLLVAVPLPLSTGYGGVSGAGNSQTINAASAFNRGYEFSLGYNGRSGELSYSVSVNAAYNKNRVTSLGTQGATPIIDGAFYSVPAITRTEVGQPIGSFYGFVYDHVAIDAADVEKYNVIARNKTGDPNAEYQSGLLPGDRIFKDVDGDGMVTESDKTFIGSPIPKWNYGANLNLRYRSFDLMVALQGVAGVDLVNGMKYYLEGVALPFNAKTVVLNRWKNPGDITDIARAGQNPGTSANLRNSSWYVENGAYARIRNLTVGYTTPGKRIRPLTGNAISDLRVYITAQNLFTFTHYTGYDPEVSGINGGLLFTRGIDLGQTPQPRSFLLGVQLGF